MESSEGSPADAEMTVLVKSPSDLAGTPPFILRLPRTALVRDAKCALAQQYPTRPRASTQRLIHAGRLLSDADSLLSSLTGDPPHVMHLVAPSPVLSYADRTLRAPSASAEQNAPPAPAPRAPAAAYAAHLTDVEAAFARLLHHQTRYAALLRAYPPAHPRALAHQLAHLQAATAQFDMSTAAQAAAIRHVAGPDPVGVPHGRMLPGVPAFAPPAFQAFVMPPGAQGREGGLQFAPAARAPDAPPAQVGAADAGGGGGANVWRRHFVFQFNLNWALLAKLAFFVVLLAQDASRSRTNMLLVFAVVIYLWQTGHLGFLRRLMNVVLPSPNQLFEMVSSMAASADGAENAEVPRSFVIRQSAVLTSYLYSFGYGFVCSLLPSWDPEPLPPLFHMFAANEQPFEEGAPEETGMPPPDADWRPEDAPRGAGHVHAD